MANIMAAKHSNEAVALTKLARQQAQTLGADEVDIPHVLLAVAVSDSLEARAFTYVGLTAEVIRDKIILMDGRREPHERHIYSSTDLKAARERAVEIAQSRHHSMVKPRHIVAAVLESVTGTRFLGGSQVVNELFVIIRERRKVRSGAQSRRHR